MTHLMQAEKELLVAAEASELEVFRAAVPSLECWPTDCPQTE